MHSKDRAYQFSLVKGKERFLIRCGAGQEEECIAHLMRWAKSGDLNFDWFDAAVLARQVSQRMFARATGQDTDPEQN